MDLSKKKCIPCEGGIPPLTEKEVADYLTNISKDWKVTGNSKISREFFFVNYRHTIDFINKIADLAESEGHHPVMHIFFGSALLELWTHSIKGLSENDFILAAKIDKL